MRFVDVTSEKLFEQAYKTAHAYGFVPAHLAISEYKKNKRTRISTYNKPDDKNLKNLATLLQFFFERNLQAINEPLYIFHSNIDRDTKSAITGSKKPDDAYITLSVIGIDGPYAEALILSCVQHIFRSLRVTDSCIRINSMGNRSDSKEYFTKLNKTIKKVKDQLQPECRRMVENKRILEAHTLLYEDEVGIAEHITPTLRLLSDNARHHFERVIEHLEAQRMKYELAPEIVELTQYGTHTVFEVSTENSNLHAHGGRYDTLPYNVYRRRVPVTSVTIALPEKTTGTHTTKQRIRKPSVFLIHAGDKARMQSLRVLSQLCNANIPIAHRLHHVKVSDQIGERIHEYPFTVIFGQEEAESNTICIRRTDTHATHTICLERSAPNEIRNCLRK